MIECPLFISFKVFGTSIKCQHDVMKNSVPKTLKSRVISSVTCSRTLSSSHCIQVLTLSASSICLSVKGKKLCVFCQILFRQPRRDLPLYQQALRSERLLQTVRPETCGSSEVGTDSHVLQTVFLSRDEATKVRVVILTLLTHTQEITVGDPTDPSTQMGALGQ